MNILDPLPNHKILSLLLTLQCTAECLHCGTNSSPRVKHKIRQEDATQLIKEAAEGNYELVVFTGGEPVLYGKGLYDLINYANSLGLLTRIVTNAYWATSLESSKKKVAKLKESGLKEINFSTGDEHAKYIKIENVLYAAKASLSVNLPVSIMIETVKDNSVTRGSLTTHPLFDELFTANEKNLINFCESPWMPLDAQEVYNYPEGLAVNKSNIDSRIGCDSIINTTTILADGRIMACCGLGTQSIPELEIADLSNYGSLKMINDSVEDDFLKRWIKIEGPEKILAWAAEKNPSIRWEDMYAHRCQACKRIYSDDMVREVIEKCYTEKIVDVLTSEWLLYYYNFTNKELV